MDVFAPLPIDPDQLRKLAEKQIGTFRHGEISEMSARDVAALVHELETHHIELAMQNEALRISHSELEDSRDRYNRLYNFSPVGYVSIDGEGLIIEANITFANMLDTERDKVLGQKLSVFVHSGSQDSYFLFFSQPLSAPGLHTCQLRLKAQGASNRDAVDKPHWVRVDCRRRMRNDKLIDIIDISLCDISEQVLSQELLKHTAYYDSLTELPNRELFSNRFKQYSAHLARADNYGAIFYIDIDNFKLINDSLGHSVGDQVLQHAANVLQMNTRAVDTVARFGGDEFVILLTELNPVRDRAVIEAKNIADQIRQALLDPRSFAGIEFRIEISIGIVLFPNGGSDIDEIISHADLAMYRAKKSGKNAIEFYHQGMQEHVTQLLDMQLSLQKAQDNQEFALHYQPQVDLNDKIVGAECLLRWENKLKGSVSPYEFIPVLEENNSMMIAVGIWVLNTACEQLVAWASMGRKFSSLTLAVNISPKQFDHKDFVAQVIDVLARTGAKPNRLVIELTENMLLKNIDTVIDKMQKLREIGVSFALDDFGTGYSSLSYLKKLPLDKIKIDQAFVRDMDTDEDNAMLVQTMIGMAEHLKLQLIAEGVETQGEKDALRDQGCCYFQGYLCSYPLSAIEFEEFVAVSGID